MATAFGQFAAPDSVTSLFEPDSTLEIAWSDSTRASGADRLAARATLSGRDGSSRRNLSFRANDVGGFDGELQQADPGGIRRRSIGWRSDVVRFAAGDLGPWKDHLLLEGTSVVSGPRDTATSRQILYGSGTRPNGLELRIQGESATLRVRQRIERGLDDDPRLSTALAASVGPIALGWRRSDSGAGGPAGQVATAGWNRRGLQMEAAWLDPFGQRSAGAFAAQAGFRRDRQRVDLQIRHLSRGFRHDGLSRRWNAGTSALALDLERAIAPDRKLQLGLDAARDSLGKVGARARTVVRIGDPLCDLRLSGTWSENLVRAPRWSVGSRLEGKGNLVVPRLVLGVSDSAQRPHVGARFDLTLRGQNQELSMSGAWGATSGPRWIAGHRTFWAGPGHLEFQLSVSGAARTNTALSAQGSVSAGW